MKKLLICLLLPLVALQFFHPKKNQSPGVEATDLLLRTNPPREIALLLKASCYDCHSNHTNYPWYSHIQPIGWYLDHHIKEGKRFLNFSEIGKLPGKQQATTLKRCSEEISDSHMPPSSYLKAHSEADLRDSERQLLITWLDATAHKLRQADAPTHTVTK